METKVLVANVVQGGTGWKGGELLMEKVGKQRSNYVDKRKERDLVAAVKIEL